MTEEAIPVTQADPLAHWAGDTALEQNGIWEDLDHGVRWRITRMGGYNLAGSMAVGELPDLASDASIEDRFHHQALIASCFVTAWEGMGAQTCSPGNVYAVLLGHPDLVRKVLGVAQDQDRFRKTPIRPSGPVDVDSPGPGTGRPYANGSGTGQSPPAAAPSTCQPVAAIGADGSPGISLR